MITEADPVWLMENDQGPTGKLLRELPADWRNGLRAQSSADQPDANPWDKLVSCGAGTPQARVFEAGASQWRALGHLARIRTGAATVRTDWPIGGDTERAARKVASHWLGSDVGLAYWADLKSTAKGQQFLRHFEAWEKLHHAEVAKRGISRAKSLPDWDEATDRIAQELVVRWMASGLGAVPGFCWWSDRATTQFFAHTATRNNLTETWVRKITARIGLRKPSFVWVSAVEIGVGEITLLGANRKPIGQLRKR